MSSTRDVDVAQHPAGRAAPVVVVVGAGIAGLAAAWELCTAARPGAPVQVVVLEAAATVGGKLALGELAGHPVDVGAESMLARRDEAVVLAQQVGLGADLQPPRAIGAGIWSGGARHPLPVGTLMGVPSGAEGLAGLLTAEQVRRFEAEPQRQWQPCTDPDVDVAGFVGHRVGAAVVDRLVEPLLGGVYAGRADRLSLRATVPALWRAAVDGTSVVAAARRAVAAGTATQGPVFTGVAGGVGRLPLAVRAALLRRGAQVRERTTVRELRRGTGGWQLVTGPTTDERVLDAAAVVLATPAAPTARLLRAVAPAAATALREVQTASVAIVTLLLPRDEVHGLQGSGVLVPPLDGRYVKAATFASAKWGWLDDAVRDHVVVRASVGRHGLERDLQVDDPTMVARAVADLRQLPGVRLPDPVATLVTRWGGGLPQYGVGHLDRVGRVVADVGRHRGLAVAGAVYEGVGVPACIASGRRAARQVLAALDQHPAGPA